MTRIERVTSPLPRECSTTELHGRILGLPSEVAGAGEGNRTLVISLEGFCSTIELHPPGSSCRSRGLLCFKPRFRGLLVPRFARLLLPPPRRPNWCRVLDSTQRRRTASRFTVCPLQRTDHRS